MTNNLIPSYLETDFNTLKSRLIQLMSKTDTFKDYNYEGANITMLMELLSYIGDLNTFYNNTIARNVFPDTADVYEVVHSHSSHLGFKARGWRSAVVNLIITLQKSVDGKTDSFTGDGYDKIYIPAWFTINTGQVDADGNEIYYCTTKDFYYDISQTTATSASFTIPLRQGEPEHIEYTGNDIVNNRIILPFYQFDHEVSPYDDDNPSIVLSVNDEIWTRVSDFYDEISGLYNEDNVYMFKYDKYGRYIIEFSSIRNIPDETDEIAISMIKSLGVDGRLGSNFITTSPDEDELSNNVFLTNIRPNTSTTITSDFYSVINSSASIGGHNPDTIPQLKEGGKLEIHSQKRNVNRHDYIGNLQSRSDIIKANVWGENESDPGNTEHYNRVYLSLIPDIFSESTIDATTLPVSGSTFSDVIPVSGSVPVSGSYLEIPSSYNSDWKIDILKHIEPRKYLCTNEVFVLPEIVFFRFDIGIDIKRLYKFDSVKNDILDKLDYYFESTNRSFNEVIDFREISNWLIDTSITKTSNQFSNTRGINSLVIRDVETYTFTNSDPLYIYPLNSDYYPQFTSIDYKSSIDNILRPIQLGYNQFPRLVKEFCIIEDES